LALGACLRSAQRVDLVVHAFLESCVFQDLATDQCIGRIGRINHVSASTQVGHLVDLFPNQHLVHATVAAGDDDCIGFGHLNHGHRVVHSGVGNFKAACSQARALLGGVGREQHLQRDAAAREVAFFLCHVDGQVAGAAEHVDAQRHRIVRRGRRLGRTGAAGQSESDAKGYDFFHGDSWCV
jgi:hypothetical protein